MVNWFIQQEEGAALRYQQRQLQPGTFAEGKFQDENTQERMKREIAPLAPTPGQSVCRAAPAFCAPFDKEGRRGASTLCPGVGARICFGGGTTSLRVP